jgi:hypothetical protein
MAILDHHANMTADLSRLANLPSIPAQRLGLSRGLRALAELQSMHCMLDSAVCQPLATVKS